MARTRAGKAVLKDVATVFSTIADLVAAGSNLEVGGIYRTLGYYAAGDGGAGTYILASGNTGDGWGSHDVGANTLVIQPEGSVTDLQYGAISGSDSTAALQAMLSSGHEWLATVPAEFTDTLVADSGANFSMQVAWVYAGVQDRTALHVKEKSGDSFIFYLDCRVMVKSKVQSDWTDYDYIGVEFGNLMRCKIDLAQSQGFCIGASARPTGGLGFSYNTVTLGYLVNSKEQLRLTNLTGGFTNENIFFGGSFRCDSTVNLAKGRVGIRITSDDASYLSHNNNVFYKPSFELNGVNITSGGYCYDIQIEYGRGNSFYDVRTESSLSATEPSDVMLVDASAVNNVVRVTAAFEQKEIRVLNSGDRSGNLVFAPETQGTLETIPVFRVNDLYQNSAHSTGSGTTGCVAKGLYGITSGGVTYTFFQAYRTGGYLSIVPSGIHPATKYRLNGCKTFLIKRDIANLGGNDGGRIQINCFNSSGTRLDDTGGDLVFGPGNVFGYWSAYGGGWRTGTSGNADYVVSVAPSVAFVEIVFLAVTNPANYYGFSIHEYVEALGKGMVKVSEKGPGGEDSLVVFGSAMPSFGTWELGKICYYEDPSPGGYVGFVCTTAGTFGGTPPVLKGFGAIAV